MRTTLSCGWTPDIQIIKWVAVSYWICGNLFCNNRKWIQELLWWFPVMFTSYLWVFSTVKGMQKF
jgi:hypothetical protein